MGRFKSLNSYSNPGPISWGFATLCFTAVICFSLFTLVFSDGLSQLLAYRSFFSAVLTKSSAVEIERDLNSIINLEPSGTVKTISGLFQDVSDKKRVRKRQAVKATYQIIKRINASRFDIAQTKLENLLSQHRNLVVRSLGAGKQAWNTIDQFQAAIESCLTDIKLTEELKISVADNTSLLENSSIQFNLVATEFSKVFDLNPIKSEKSEELPVYSSGFLTGLPQLQGVEDGLESSIALRDRLEVLQTSVKIKGPNAHRQFQNTLKTYRSKVADIQSRWNSLVQERLNTERAIEESNKLLQKHSTEARNLGIKVLMAQAKPDLNDFSADVYQLFAAGLEKLGVAYDLPSLSL